MKKILAFLFALVATPFADDMCTGVRNQLLFTIPFQETTTCHVIGAVPYPGLMGFFFEMIDGSKMATIYEEGYEGEGTIVDDEYSLKFIKCIEDDGKFVRKYMTSRQIVDKLLRSTVCSDSYRFSVVPLAEE